MISHLSVFQGEYREHKINALAMEANRSLISYCCLHRRAFLSSDI